MNREASPFRSLDDVFKDFANTNSHRGRHYSVVELLLETPHAYNYHERHFLFYRSSGGNITPYTACVRPIDGPTATWINIRLYNNEGFSASLIKRRKNTEHHILTYEDDIPNIRAIFQGYSVMSASSDPSTESFKIRMYPDDPLRNVHVSLTFEPGFPYADEDAYIPTGELNARE